MPSICVATRNSLRSSAPLLPDRFFHRLLVRYRFLQTAPELIRNCSGTDFQTAFCNLLGRFGDIVSVSDGFFGPVCWWNDSRTALELLWNGSGTALERPWNCSGTDLNLLGRFDEIVSISYGVLVWLVAEVALILHWNYSGITLESLWNCSRLFLSFSKFVRDLVGF